MLNSASSLPFRIPMLDIKSIEDLEETLSKAKRTDEGDLILLYRRETAGRTLTGFCSPGEEVVFSRERMIKHVQRKVESEAELVGWMLSSGDWDLILKKREEDPEGGTA